MKTNLLYGQNGLEIEVPDNAFVVEPKDLPAMEDEREAIKQALRNPIGTAPLREMVKPTDTVAIVISDITRPTPNHILVPLLIEELSHVPLENFVVINGTGTHRDQTREEFVQMLGDWVVDNIRIINNNCHDKSTQVNLGRSKFGCDVYLNKEYVEADFRIVTGFIEPHFFAGFSGGPKGIMPGIAGIDTIMTFHNARMIGDPLSTWGNMVNNPVQDMTREINGLCKPHFMLNVTLNKEKEITNVFAGELYEAHDKGCAFVKEHAMVRCDERFDVVITSNSGYPLDQNLYQAVKGMSASQKIVKKGGAIIVASECSDGLPSHGNYAKIFEFADSPQGLLDLINNPEFKMFDQWQVQKQAVIQVWSDVYVYSKLTDEQVKGAMLKPTHNIEKTLEELKQAYGENMTVAVLPLGPLTIPYVEE
ncbi:MULTISPECIES: nickel-dependent lactate racemase [Neobacillus]|uniref:Nickel-dependent lactate racemase n=1 Tax=Neobacillus rhizophilus TaxID=2833579 RepID=A0A942YY28_9BACI|nr:MULTISPECIES: nickel-dependent lactate racemase [Neobacillus]MBS4214501.1 nickel-dependent lactate racemase [Neobacillus rhizophilus]MBU8918406.1 nickel-dependent lactate racemase [Bacillus sp. FJAT-29953]